MNIAAELSQVASHGGFFALTVGGDETGWHAIGRSYAAGYADLVDATVRRYRGTDPRIGASLVHLGHATRLWSPVLACALGHGVVPDLTDLQRGNDGPQLRLPTPVGEAIKDPANPCAESLYRLVVQDHMERLEAGLKVKLAPGLLSGNIASALVGASKALLQVRPELREPVLEITRALLNTGRLANTGALTITGDHLGFTRNSCCLFYRLPNGGKCGDCPL